MLLLGEWLLLLLKEVLLQSALLPHSLRLGIASTDDRVELG